MSLSFFADKVILELKCTKHFFRASKNTNSVFSAPKQIRECEATDAQKLLSQSEKVAKCNFKSKAQLHEKCFFNEMNCFLQCRRQHFMHLSFFAEKVILELKCNKITSLELLRTPDTDFHEFELFCRKSHFRA